jgi:hypothetical protein
MAAKITINLLKEFDKLKENKKDIELVKLVSALKAATPVDTGRARDGWHTENGKIINNVEYIDELNAGSSAQAPSHFIEKTLLSFSEVQPNGVIVTPE